MASAFQNRLIGTIVLVALAVIFLPDILDGEKISHKDNFVPIPQRPAAKPAANTVSFPHEQVNQVVTRQVEVVNDPVLDDEPGAMESGKQDNSVGQEVSQSEPAASSAAELDALAEQIDNEPVSAGWVVQLGVFRHDKNVRELLGKLKNAGYRAFSQKIKTSSGVLNKVFVGPDVDKDKMQEAIPHLKEITALNGRVTEFTVK